MPQDESPEIKELRSQMHKGCKPLLDAIESTYLPYLLARKGWNRKNEEVRDHIALLNNTFAEAVQRLRAASRNTQGSGEGMIASYKELSR